MRDRELYATILGITDPWGVERVEIEAKDQVVHVWLRRSKEGAAVCPECGKAAPIYDHRDREWRHLDTCQFQTRLHAPVPRVSCSEHGVVQTRVPWATPGSKFTMLFERLVIDWLHEASVKAVAERMSLGWDATWGIMTRAVERGLGRRELGKVVWIGVDEKSFRRRHDYVTVVTDLAKSTVLCVVDDRRRESLEAFWAIGLNDAQREAVEAIAMDMWEPYVQATLAQIPDAGEKIVFDAFHIAKHMNEAVDRVRRAEHKELRGRGDDRLTGTRYAWLTNPENLTDEARRAFATLRRSNLKVARAWALKDTFRSFWTFTYAGAARRFFNRWYFWATHSKLPPMIEKARMLKKRLENVLTYFRHGVTNAVTEGLNSKIQWIRYRARGFRNRQNFKTAIYFHCGGLDLYPH